MHMSIYINIVGIYTGLGFMFIMSVCVYVQLQMLGYDISWAAFNIIEVMSSTKFTYKVGLVCM